MNRLSFPDYESLSQAAASKILSIVQAKPDTAVCLATGSTPTRTYELLAGEGKTGLSCFKALKIIKLDEWGGLPASHSATCEYYLHKYVIAPLQISPDRYFSFQSDALDPPSECARIRKELDSIKLLDLCILGLGINGHLGFNEPADFLQPHAHIAELTDETRRHRMIEDTAVKPSYGYTLGMADLLQARKIMLLVSGSHKQRQLQRLLEGKIETSFPASFLWLHPDVELYTDI
jgi:galactosamine-6-phosphate isomerase